jgi:hypothetical protein
MSSSRQLTEVQSWEEVPEFASEAEEADFWATHSLGEMLLAEMAPIATDLLPITRSQPVKSELIGILDQLPEPLLLQVRDFADFLRHKHERLTG